MSNVFDGSFQVYDVYIPSSNHLRCENCLGINHEINDLVPKDGWYSLSHKKLSDGSVLVYINDKYLTTIFHDIRFCSKECEVAHSL